MTKLVSIDGGKSGGDGDLPTLETTIQCCNVCGFALFSWHVCDDNPMAHIIYCAVCHESYPMIVLCDDDES